MKFYNYLFLDNEWIENLFYKSLFFARGYTSYKTNEKTISEDIHQ